MSRLGRVKSVLDVTGTIALIVAASVFVWTAVGRRSSATPKQVENVSFSLASSQVSNVLGTGRVAIVEFSDFQCPFCIRHAAETWPSIRRELIDSGRARYVALEFPLEQVHPLAMQAGEGAECAARQGKYWAMHDRLFESKLLSKTDLVTHARALKMDVDQFSHCLEGNEMRGKVQTDLAEGRRLGVTGTPAFFVGIVQPDGGIKLIKKIRGAASLEVFSREVDAASAAAAAANAAVTAGGAFAKL